MQGNHIWMFIARWYTVCGFLQSISDNLCHLRNWFKFIFKNSFNVWCANKNKFRPAFGNTFTSTPCIHYLPLFFTLLMGSSFCIGLGSIYMIRNLMELNIARVCSTGSVSLWASCLSTVFKISSLKLLMELHIVWVCFSFSTNLVFLSSKFKFNLTEWAVLLLISLTISSMFLPCPYSFLNEI